jgi:hypothetical protein
MKVRSLFTLWMILVSVGSAVVCAESAASSSTSESTPLEEYVLFLNEKVEKAVGDVASKTAKVEQLKKTVAELEKKQTATQNVGTVGALAKDTEASQQTNAEYIEKKKELDVAIAALEGAADFLMMLKKQHAAAEYTKNKLIELEQIMSGAVQMNLDDAEIAALAEDDEVVTDADVAAASVA